MKKIFTTVLVALSCAILAIAADNNSAKNIIGNYKDKITAEETTFKIFQNPDGTFTCKISGVTNDLDPETGDCWKDTCNPDKSLRDRYIHDLSIIEGLKYNAEKKQWDGAKIYDPNRGIKANVTIRFNAQGNLEIKGTVLGIGETVIWYPVK